MQINTENFQQMLSQFSINELEGMIEKFPYFQQAHLLLAKKYQQENSPKFDQQLQLAALYVQDRELLYALFSDRNVVKAKSEAQVKELEVKERDVTAIEPVKQIEQQLLAQQDVVIEETVNTFQSQHPLNDESVELALKEIKNTVEAIQKISEQITEDEPVQIVQLPDVDSESELKETSQAPEAPVTEKLAAKVEVPQPETNADVKLSSAISDTKDEQEIALQETIEEIPGVEAPPLETFSRVEPHTFDEWLNAFNNKSVTIVSEKAPVDKEPAADEELTRLFAENITVDYLHGIVKEETNYAKGLERFIEDQIQKHKQPVIKKKRPQKEPDIELVTETMAKVYEMQKKYNKAINVYEALALKFPEKSSLFAARINFLKNIL